MATYEYHNAGNSEAQEKVALSRLFAPDPDGVRAATGVLGGLVVSQTATASGSVHIVSGSAVVHPTMYVGASLLVNDSGMDLDIFTTNPMGGLPRNDIVVFDSLTASIAVIVGTPNATPTDPTVPATAVALARLRHAASATTIPTAKIDPLIVPTALRGVNPVPSVRKSANQVVNNSTTTVDDTELRFSAAAGHTYIIDMTLIVSVSGGSSLSDFKVGFTIPGGSITFGGIGPDPAMAGGSSVGQGQFLAWVSAVTSTISYGLFSTGWTTIRIHGSYVCPTSGVVALRWAQNTATTVDTTVAAGSTLVVTQV